MGALHRPCIIEVVKAISAKCAALQGPSGTVADGKLDEECRLHRDRIKALDVADVCLVEWYSAPELLADGIDSDAVGISRYSGP